MINRLIDNLAILAAFLVVSANVSCSKDAAPEPMPGSAIEINLTSSIASSPFGGVKSPVIDGGDSKAELAGIHFVRKDSTIAPTTYEGISPLSGDRGANGAITFATGAAPTYSKQGTDAWFVAYWPGTNATPGTNKVSWNVDGKTDILVASAHNAGSYLLPKSTNMLFEHQLAQLEVVCKATSESGVSTDVIRSTWGSITAIEIVNNFSTASFDYTTQTTQFETQSNIALLKDNYETTFETIDIPDNNNSTINAAGMFSPQQGSIVLRVTTSIMGAVNLEVQLRKGVESIDFERGKRHRVTIEFEKTQMLVALYTEITNWSTAYQTNGEINMPSEVFSKPSEGILDMRYAGLVKSGMINASTISVDAVLTKNSYNPNVYSDANADNNGGYKETAPVACQELVYYKLEIAKANETAAGGTAGWHADGTKANWTTAWAACKAKAPAGAWRLPRASELVVMYFNRDELHKTPDFTPFESAFWSGTENTTAASFYTYLLTGSTYVEPKTNLTRFVRCVRELSTPAVEDYYYTDNTWSRDLNSAKTVEGVVHWVDPTNPKHFKIVSMDEPPANWEGGTNVAGYLPWSTELVVKTNINDVFNGKANTLALMQRDNAAEYKAAKWCFAKNTGLSTPATSVTTSDAAYKWYLPAQDEMQHLFCASWGVAPSVWADGSVQGARPSFSAAAGYPDAWTARFAPPFASLASASYWSSTEFNGGNSRIVNFTSGAVDYNYKTHTNNRARCVREITL